MASGSITIQRDRTETVRVEFPSGSGAGYASDTFTAEVSATRSPSNSPLLTFTVDTSNLSASDYIELTADNSLTSAVTANDGWLDVIRTSSGEPLRVFDEPVQVKFVNMPTAV